MLTLGSFLDTPRYAYRENINILPPPFVSYTPKSNPHQILKHTDIQTLIQGIKNS